jgi:carbamoyl-phosphate synthase small subunit
MLALEDGTVFEGRSFGAAGQRDGEVVFNTSMTGYQEVLTDPSYRGQIVAMTYPLIGNYGVNPADAESRAVWLEGFVVRERSRITSNWRSEQDLSTYLSEAGVLGIEGVDTRELTKRLRVVGALKGVLSTEDLDPERLVAKARASAGLVGRDLVAGCSVVEPYDWSKADPRLDAEGDQAEAETEPGRYRVAVMDLGVKYGILRRLRAAGCSVTVLPATTSPEQIVAAGYDGVLISNGPGDPDPLNEVIGNVRRLVFDPPEGRTTPVFGICMGQHILVQAMGGRTFKLKFGHHGANHPVKDLRTGQVAITVQNHGFCGDIDSLPTDQVEITHVNLNDRTLEGIRHKELPVFSVQYHPEASPGPHDARYLFDEFVENMKRCRG